MFCLQKCVQVVHLLYAGGVTLGNLYLDACSLPNILTVANSPNRLLFTVTMQDMNITHRELLYLLKFLGLLPC